MNLIAQQNHQPIFLAVAASSAPPAPAQQNPASFLQAPPSAGQILKMLAVVELISRILQAIQGGQEGGREAAGNPFSSLLQSLNQGGGSPCAAASAGASANGNGTATAFSFAFAFSAGQSQEPTSCSHGSPQGTWQPANSAPRPNQPPANSAPRPNQPPANTAPQANEPPANSAPRPNQPPANSAPRPNQPPANSAPRPNQPPANSAPKASEPPANSAPKANEPPANSAPRPNQPPANSAPKANEPPANSAPQANEPPANSAPRPNQPPANSAPRANEPPANSAPRPNQHPANSAPRANEPPANSAPKANEPPAKPKAPPTQNDKMWDVWFDHTAGQKTEQKSPIVLDLNRNGRPDITGANITGNGKIDGATTMFDLDPTQSSWSEKSMSKGMKAKMGMTDKLPEGELKADGMWHYGREEKREKTEWLAKDGGDGLLAWDVNGDGKINSGKELFGNFDVDGSKKFEDGYQKLAHHFDKNKDGVVNGQELQGLSVWKDGNADGVTQEGELKGVADYGITSLNVSQINRNDMSSSYQWS